MGRRKIVTTVYIEPGQDALLKALSERTRVPVAEYIRQGIDLVLDRHRALLPGQLDLFGSPPVTLHAVPFEPDDDEED